MNTRELLNTLRQQGCTMLEGPPKADFQAIAKGAKRTIVPISDLDTPLGSAFLLKVANDLGVR